MISRRLALLLALLAGLTRPAMAEETPEDFVADLYEAHMPSVTGEAPGIFDDEVLMARFLASDLAAAVNADKAASAKTGEAGLLSFDPVSDSQDPDIRDLRIQRLEDEAGHPQVEATFSRSDQTKRLKLIYDLVKEGDGWKVFNIRRPDGDRWNLREIMQLN